MSQQAPEGQPPTGDDAPAKWRRRPGAVLAVLAPLAVLAVVLIAVSGDLARGGLRPCERLDQRLCADLGPGACDVWTRQLQRRGAASSEPHHWRRNRTFALDLALHKLLGWDAAHADNPLCYDELEDALYPAILSSVRASVEATTRSLHH
jgi:hypothetical protein